MGPLTTNAYSGLPGGAESAFLHLHALSGGTHDVTGLAAQMLCAFFGDPHGQLAAPQKCRRRFGLLDDPVGHGDGFDGVHRSIRHAARMHIFLHLRESQSSPQACCLGLLAGGIALAKPSAALLLALPLAVFFFAAPNRRSLQSVLLSIGIALIVSTPWLLDNTITVGSPFFPLLTGLFGYGPWTEIQSANWEAAHTGGGSLSSLWTEWLAYPILRTLAMECDPLAGSGWAGHGTKK